MLRNLLSVIAGILTGWILFVFTRVFAYIASPKPEGMDFYEMTMMKEFMNGIPTFAWIIIILGYAVGSFAGGFVIGKFSESPTRFFPILAGVVFTVGWIVYFMTLPHPFWIIVSVLPLFLPFTILGHRIAVNSRIVPESEFSQF